MKSHHQAQRRTVTTQKWWGDNDGKYCRFNEYFNQEASGARRAARNVTVFIADRGETAHGLRTIVEYRKPVGKQGSIVDLLAKPNAAAIEFEPRRAYFHTKTADLS